MKLLIIGGTKFLGRHLTEIALERGHEVWHFNRGVTNRDLFPKVRTIYGDRKSPIILHTSQDWDAVIDTCCFFPLELKTLLDVVRNRMRCYTLISSRSVYKDLSLKMINESHPLKFLKKYDGQLSEHTYSAYKAECERLLLSEIGDKSLIVRAGLMIGQYDQSGRLFYWIQNMENQELLAPGPKEKPVQVIDVRDLSFWVINSVENQIFGTYNVCGQSINIGEFLKTIHTVCQSTSHLLWVPEDFLLANKDIKKNAFNIYTHSKIPMWVPNQFEGIMTMDCSKAVKDGLSYRSLSSSISDYISSFSDREMYQQFETRQKMLSPTQERLILQAWKRSTILNWR